MLQFNLKTLNKSGFFVGGLKPQYNINMTTFVFCTRNNFMMLDVVYFLLLLRKSLFFLENMFLTNSKFLFILEDLNLSRILYKIIGKFSKSISTVLNSNNSYKFLEKSKYSVKKSFMVIKKNNLTNNFYFKLNNFIVNNLFDFLSQMKVKSFFLDYINFFFQLRKKRALLNSDFSNFSNNDFFFNYLYKTSFYFYVSICKNLNIRRMSFFSNKNLNVNFQNLDFYFFEVRSFHSLNNLVNFRNLNLLNFFILLNNSFKFYLFFKYFLFNKLIYLKLFLTNKNYFFNFLDSFELVVARRLNFYQINKRILNKNLIIKSGVFNLYEGIFKYLVFLTKKQRIFRKWLVFFKTKSKYSRYFSYRKVVNLYKKYDDFVKFLLFFKSFMFGEFSNLSNKKNNYLKNETISYLTKYNFVSNYNYILIRKQIFLWTHSWLNGAITNFYGLKKTYKKYDKDFILFRSLPDVVVLFGSKKEDTLVNEIFSFLVPFVGFSDTHMNPFLFHYYIPSNVASSDVLYFYFRLVLESFLRGLLKKTLLRN